MENNNKEREIMTTEEDMDESDHENNENKKYDESRIYYVYEHIRLDKMEPFYIGKGKGERAYELYRNPHHDAITDEYGHAVVIIADKLTEEEAYWLERDTIEDYVFNLGNGIDIKGHDDYDHELPHLTNMDWGGIGGKGGVPLSEEAKQKMKGRIPWNKGKKGIQAGENHPLYGKHHSEETKQRISEGNKGKKQSKEAKQRISEGMKGRNAYANKTEEEMEEIRRKMSEKKKGTIPWNKGKKGMYHHSEETKQRISEGNKGKKQSKEAKLKISETKKGIEFSEEHRLNLSKSHKGKKASEYTKRKMSEARSKKVICITTGKIFDSLKEASNYYKCGHIHDCCKGKQKHAGKLPDNTPLEWKYLKDYNNEFNGILIHPTITK